MTRCIVRYTGLVFYVHATIGYVRKHGCFSPGGSFYPARDLVLAPVKE